MTTEPLICKTKKTLWLCPECHKVSFYAEELGSWRVCFDCGATMQQIAEDRVDDGMMDAREIKAEQLAAEQRRHIQRGDREWI